MTTPPQQVRNGAPSALITAVLASAVSILFTTVIGAFLMLPTMQERLDGMRARIDTVLLETHRMEARLKEEVQRHEIRPSHDESSKNYGRIESRMASIEAQMAVIRERMRKAGNGG